MTVSPAFRFGLMSRSKISFWVSSGVRIMMMSAAFAASAVFITVRPSASAFAFELEPSYSPTITSRPLSCRFSACACPWLP